MSMGRRDARTARVDATIEGRLDDGRDRIVCIASRRSSESEREHRSDGSDDDGRVKTRAR